MCVIEFICPFSRTMLIREFVVRYFVLFVHYATVKKYYFVFSEPWNLGKINKNVNDVEILDWFSCPWRMISIIWFLCFGFEIWFDGFNLFFPNKFRKFIVCVLPTLKTNYVQKQTIKRRKIFIVTFREFRVFFLRMTILKSWLWTYWHVKLNFTDCFWLTWDWGN